MTTPGSQRKRGLVLILIGVAIGAGLFVALIALSRMGVIAPEVTEHIRHGVVVRELTYSKIWGLPIVVPLFTTMIGLVSVITGRTFGELAHAYETTSGGKRFLASVLVVALALGVIFGLVAIAFAIML